MFLKLDALATINMRVALCSAIWRRSLGSDAGSVLRVLGLSIAIGLGGMLETGLAQTQPTSGNVPLQAADHAASDRQASASISGIVLDPSGAVVRGATVKLAGSNGATERTAFTRSILRNIGRAFPTSRLFPAPLVSFETQSQVLH